MREDAFRAFLAPRLSPAAVASYLSNLRAVERLLGIDMDEPSLQSGSVDKLKAALVAAGMPRARASDCGAALQQYAVFRSGGPGLHSNSRPSDALVPPPRAMFVSQASVAELMRLYADVLEELRSRRVLRTANGPVGDYAEYLFANAFDWTLASNSAAHHDAIDPAGTRYQIKARRVGGVGSRQLGALRCLPDAHFDLLAAVLFDRDMQVLRAALIPHRVVVEHAKRVEHTNSWRFMLSDSVWLIPTVRDATDALRDAARQF